MLDQIAMKKLIFNLVNQAEEDRSDPILRLLEHNVEKAEILFKVFDYMGDYSSRPSLPPLTRLYAEFFLRQKKIELLRWQWESALFPIVILKNIPGVRGL